VVIVLGKVHDIAFLHDLVLLLLLLRAVLPLSPTKHQTVVSSLLLSFVNCQMNAHLSQKLGQLGDLLFSLWWLEQPQ
jgi:hypothetical protein